MKGKNRMSKVTDFSHYSSLIKEGYETNDYNEFFRASTDATPFEQYCMDTFLSALPKNAIILDLGCGAARKYDPYMLSKGCSLTGIDFSEKQIERARQNCPDGKFFVCDMSTFESDIKYDGITLFYSLYHIHREQHAILLKQIYDMLSPDGRVLLTVRAEDGGDVKSKENFCGKPMYWSYYDYKTFERLADKQGFSSEVIDDEQYHGSKESHLWVLLKK